MNQILKVNHIYILSYRPSIIVISTFTINSILYNSNKDNYIVNNINKIREKVGVISFKLAKKYTNVILSISLYDILHDTVIYDVKDDKKEIFPFPFSIIDP